MCNTQLSIAYELCAEYNIGCIACGSKDIQLHHYPSKGELKGYVISEILFATIFPLCNDHHTEYHTTGMLTCVFNHIQYKIIDICALIELRSKTVVSSDGRYIKYNLITLEHINRCVARMAKVSYAK